MIEFDSGVALALSGGGFRASLFHLGSLWRLNELAWLPKISRIAGVSGGAITTAVLGLNWANLGFRNGIASNFRRQVAQPMRELCSHSLDVVTLLRGVPTPWRWRRPGNMLVGAFRRRLSGDATLATFPDHPEFQLVATNLSTGFNFRFSKTFVGDLYRFTRAPDFLIAECVAASCAFPPFFSPFLLRVANPEAWEEAWQPVGTAPHPLPNPLSQRRVLLTDGGVFDNLMLDAVYKRYKTLLISDASTPFGPSQARWWFSLTARAATIASYQGYMFRKRLLTQAFRSGARLGAYWTIAADIREFDAPNTLGSSFALTGSLARLRTRLNRFTESEQCRLINWGYAVCDAAMRQHVARSATTKPRWPYPRYKLG